MPKGAIEETSEKEGSLGKGGAAVTGGWGWQCKPSCWSSEDDVEGEGLGEKSLDLEEQSFVGNLK